MAGNKIKQWFSREAWKSRGLACREWFCQLRNRVCLGGERMCDTLIIKPWNFIQEKCRRCVNRWKSFRKREKIEWEVKKANKKPMFKSLAPTDKAERIDIYKKALSQALKDKDVYNIAVTGAYGSGKSSFLRTYFKEQAKFWPIRFKKHKVITISLAELASKEDVHVGETPAPEITRQEIELSILHQLFFHERAGALTESHFTKIQKYGFWKLTSCTCGVMLFLVACTHLLKPRLLTEILCLPNLGFLKAWNWWHWLCVAAVLLGLAWIVAHIVRIAAQIAVRKLSVDPASIEIANTQEKSILNAHIDEIIYFFSDTKHDVVLIEDLDRFKQPSIFVKLREINHLINNSKEVNQRVRFIYAISDGIFNDKTRTKFFDFIIPIIPMVDASNAGDMLHKLVPEHVGNVVDAVALYLNDARLLNNIANEFYIYRNKQENPNQKDDEQILALVVYKNLYPSDFEDLRTQKTGLLADALHQRKDLVEAIIAKKDERIAEIEAKIAEAKQVQLRDIKELRQLMIAAVMQGALDNSSGNYICRQINCGDEQFSIGELAKDDKFEKFRKAKSYTYYASYHYHPEGIPFGKLEQTVYGDVSYEERLKQIQIKADDTALREQERKLNEEKVQLKTLTIQQLLQTKILKLNWEKHENEESTKEQRNFIYDMLYGGYITENYPDHVSFFHEGSLSKEDYQFIRGVRIKEQTLEANVNLYNVEKVIAKLDLGNFSQVEVLNFSFVDALMSNHADSDKCAHVLKRIKKYDSYSIAFISSYVEDRQSAGVLIHQLCADKSKLLWKAIEKSNLSEQAKIRIAQSIIENGDEADVIENLKGSENFLSAQSDYFKWAIPEERLRNIAKGLSLQFTAIAEETSRDNVQFVYENGLYAVTPEMLRRVIPAELWDEVSFKKANYTYLHNVDLSPMLKHVNEHMEDYVTKVLLQLAQALEKEIEDEIGLINWSEFGGVLEDDPEHVREILQHDWEIDEEVMKLFIKKEKKKWKSALAYGDISDESTSWLYQYHKVELTWENVLHIYELDKETFADYIFSGDVAFELSMLGKPQFNKSQRESWERMQVELLSEKHYEHVTEELVGCFDKEVDVSIIKHCNSKILERLIEQRLIVRGKEEYAIIDEVDPALSLRFFLLNYDELNPMIEELDFEDFQIEALLRQKEYLTEEQKLNVLEHANAEEIVGERSVMTIVDFFMQLDKEKYKLSEGVWKVIKAALTYKNISTSTRLKLFNKYQLTDHKEIDRVVALLDRQYVDENGKLYNHLKPVTEEILRFSKYLDEINYLKSCINYEETKGFVSVKYYQ